MPFDAMVVTRGSFRPDVEYVDYFGTQLRTDGSGVLRDRLPARPLGLERRDVGLVPEGDPDVVEALQQPPAGVVVDVEGVLDRVDALARPDGPRLEVDGDRATGVVVEEVPELLDDLLVDLG